MVVGAFVVAAILTPPDVLSQFMLAIPLCILYELGIWLSGFISSVSRAPEQVDADAAAAASAAASAASTAAGAKADRT